MVHGPGAPPAVRELSARELPTLLERVHADLADRREVLDDLNVFPVPDGDTGTNLVLTVRASLTALHQAGDASGAERSREVVRGAVRGARGNSGVILSQVIRAVVERLAGHARIDATTYADALEDAAGLAYEAVAEPVEGTILTAIAAASRAARAAADAGAGLVEASERTCEAVAEAVAATPEQLAVLRDAGVVDAGARGFEVVLAAVHGHLTGEAAPVHLDTPPPSERAADPACHGSLVHPFEVQYLLDASDEKAGEIRRALEALGDSVVVVAAGGLLNVHVHTDRIGPAIEVGLAHGRPSDLEVTHLGEQIASRATPAAAGIGVVAVLDGPGVRDLVEGSYVEVVPGGAGRLPSVADLLAAVDGLSARDVLLLPGHRNAVAAARQAVGEAAGRSLHVIESATTPPAVLAALAVLEADGEVSEVVAAVTDAAAAVRAGEVVGATRAATTPIGPVEVGRPLAVVDGEVVAADADPIAALRHLAEPLRLAEAELVTLMVGAEVEPGEREAAVAALTEVAGDAELEVVDLGQRPARYWVGAE